MAAVRGQVDVDVESIGDGKILMVIDMENVVRIKGK